MELRKRPKTSESQAPGVNDSTSGSDEDWSGMEGGAATGDTSLSNDSISLEAEGSGSDGEEGTPEESGSREKRGMRPKNGGDVGGTELGAGKGHERGGHSHVKAVTQGRRKVKANNVEGKGKEAGGSKGKAVDRGEVGEKEGKGMVDVVVRHRCSLEAVCRLNAELVDFQKAAVEGTVWRQVLKSKPFVMDRHLVRALMESWNPETKAFMIGRTEVPFSVYDVALLTGLPATGKTVKFERGDRVCEVEEMVKGAMEERL